MCSVGRSQSVHRCAPSALTGDLRDDAGDKRNECEPGEEPGQCIVNAIVDGGDVSAAARHGTP